MSPRSLEIGPLEMDVLGMVADKPCSVSQIQESLKRAGKDLAYTTVMTVLVRLHNKGFLERKKQGRQFLYERARKATRVGESVLTKIKRSFFRNERLAPFLALLDSDEDLTPEELRELKRAVEARLKNSEKP